MKYPDYVKDYVKEPERLNQKINETRLAIELGRLPEKEGLQTINGIQQAAEDLKKQISVFQKAVEALPPDQKAIMETRYINGVPLARIAKIAGCSVWEIGKIHRAAVKNLNGKE